jgi:transcriptional regulator
MPTEKSAALPEHMMVTATDAKNRFGAILDTVGEGRVVVVTKHDAPRAVLMSMEVYQALAPEAERDAAVLAPASSTGGVHGLKAAIAVPHDEAGRSVATELLVLKLLDREPLTGYAMSRHIRSITGDELVDEEGDLYPALHAMERKGWVRSSWVKGAENRPAKSYRITRAGRRQLGVEVDAWAEFSRAVQSITESA